MVAYQAKFEPYSEGEHHFVKVFNIDGTWNGNGWAVTDQARADSLVSFFTQPLLGPEHLSPHHVVDANPKHPHYGVHAVIGKPVDVINNGVTYGIYEVTVPEAWEMIQAGKLGPVSPSVHILEEEEQSDGRKLITKFVWDHTLFVDSPAFPNAGVVGTCTASNPSLCGFAQAAQAAFEQQELEGKGFDLSDPVQASSVQEQIRQAQFGRSRTPEDVAKLERIISGVRQNDWSNIDPVTGLGKIIQGGNEFLAGGGIFQEIIRSEQFGYARNAQGQRVSLESLFPHQQIVQASKTLRVLRGFDLESYWLPCSLARKAIPHREMN
jgi:hypothetical protein